MLPSMAARPLPLFEPYCECGGAPIQKGGLCLPCYTKKWRSLHYFGGYRDQVLARDKHACRVCGAREQLIVHHRMRVDDPDWMITLCTGCHATTHRLSAVTRWLPELLLVLWIEQHVGLPVQSQLPLPELIYPVDLLPAAA